jgi:hypothetical protein
MFCCSKVHECFGVPKYQLPRRSLYRWLPKHSCDGSSRTARGPFREWQTHPFESREDWRPREKDAITHTLMVLDKHRLRVREAEFERLLDLLMKDFKIDDRATLKSHVEVATRITTTTPLNIRPRPRAARKVRT